MPNHITTVCTVTGPPADVDRFVATHIVAEDEKPFFGFQTVIPAPACVEGTESGTESDAGFYALTGFVSSKFACFPIMNPMVGYAKHSAFPVHQLSTNADFAAWLAEHRPDVLEKGRKMLACFRETGCPSWYEWNIRHWGTKWNSYEYAERSREPGRFVFQFETAWSVPKPILAKLTELHPTLTFALASIDEGGPHYVGEYAGTLHRLEEVEPTRERTIYVYGNDERWYDGEDDDTADEERAL